MAKHKYTYQDWVEGKWIDDTSTPANNIIGLIIFRRISEDDASKILTEQNAAFLNFLSVASEEIKRDFSSKYEKSLLKDEFLDYNIQGLKKFLDEVRTAHELMVRYAVQDKDGRFCLSKTEVDRYNSAERNDLQVTKEVIKYMEAVSGEYDIDEKQTSVSYILRANLYNWLVWFKRQQESKNIEPSLNINSDELPKGITDLIGNNKSYNWLKNPKEQLPELYKRLIDKTLIDPDTSKEQFDAVFTAKPLNSINSVTWNGATNLLAYFIDHIYTNGIIHYNIDHWSVAKKCFNHANNLAQLRINYQSNKNKKHPGKPKDYKLIDEVLKDL